MQGVTYAVLYKDNSITVGQDAKTLLTGWGYEVFPDYLIITKTPMQFRDWQARRLPLNTALSTDGSHDQQLLRALYREGCIQVLREVQGVQDVHEIT